MVGKDSPSHCTLMEALNLKMGDWKICANSNQFQRIYIYMSIWHVIFLAWSPCFQGYLNSYIPKGRIVVSPSSWSQTSPIDPIAVNYQWSCGWRQVFLDQLLFDWWFQIFFAVCSPLPLEMIQFDCILYVFFKWVGSTTSYSYPL